MYQHINFLKVIILLVGLSACSNLATKPEKQNAETNNVIESAQTRIEQLIELAKSQGPYAVNYLASDLYLKARTASQAGESKSALFLYKYLLSLKPNEDYIKEKYAIELIRGGELQDSISLLQELFYKDQQKNSDLGFVLAGVYQALSENAKMNLVYHDLMKISQTQEEACVLYSKNFLQEGQLEKANQILLSCWERNKKSSTYHYNIGKNFLEKSFYDQAIHNFELARKIDSKDYQSVLALGLIWEEKEKWDKALSLYQGYLKTEPTNNVIATRVVQVLFSQEKFKEALPYVEDLVAGDSQNLNLKLRLGILYTDAKRYDEAIGVFKELAYAIPESDKVHYYLGAIFQEKQDLDNALKYYVKIPATSSLYEDATIQSALIYDQLIRRGELSQALSKVDNFNLFLENRIKDLPKLHFQFEVLKARVFDHIGNMAKAIAALEGIHLDENFSEDHQYYLASMYEKNGAIDKAIKIMRDIVVKNPNNAHAHNFLGYTLLESGKDFDEAYNFIKQAIALDPDDGFIRDSLGWYYYKVGQFDKALEQLKIARDKTGSDKVVSEHLAVVYSEMKDYELAKKYFMESFEKSEDNDQKQRLLKEIFKIESIRSPASERRPGSIFTPVVVPKE